MEKSGKTSGAVCVAAVVHRYRVWIDLVTTGAESSTGSLRITRLMTNERCMCTVLCSEGSLCVVEVSRLELRREANVLRVDGLFYKYPLALHGVTLVQSVRTCLAITMDGWLINGKLPRV